MYKISKDTINKIKKTWRSNLFPFEKAMAKRIEINKIVEKLDKLVRVPSCFREVYLLGLFREICFWKMQSYCMRINFNRDFPSHNRKISFKKSLKFGKLIPQRTEDTENQYQQLL